jgi:hypothetical protein
LAAADIYGPENKGRLTELLVAQRRLTEELVQVEEDWMTAADALEAAEKAEELES